MNSIRLLVLRGPIVGTVPRIRYVSPSGESADGLLPFRENLEKPPVWKRFWSTADTDLPIVLIFPRFLEGVQPLWTVITGLFGRAIVTVSIISERPLSVFRLKIHDSTTKVEQ